MYKHLTGHDHYLSPTETDDDCGNCGGSRCERCKEVFEVTLTGKFHYDKEAAELEEKTAINAATELFDKAKLPKDYNQYDDPRYAIVDNVLCVQVWKRPSFKGDSDYGYKYLPCNTEALSYAEKFKEIQILVDQYKECKCTNKDDDKDECPTMGCRDSSCYREMKIGKRTEKKWYM